MPLPSTFVEGFHDREAVEKMIYGPLGHTGLVVSKLGLGGASLCTIYGEFAEEEAIRTIRAGLRAGINYIDTAPWYGQGKSEELLGKALQGVPRQAYYIATKIGRYEKDPLLMSDFSAAKTRASVERSLGLLGLDHVDVIQAHDLEFADDLEQLLREALPTLRTLVTEGKARFVGITGYQLSLLREAWLQAAHKPDLVLSYARNTLIDNTLMDFIPFFKENKVGVINAAGPAMGLLTNQGPPTWHPATPAQKALCKRASEYTKEQGVELGRLAVYHSLLPAGIDLHLVGMNTSQLLESNLDVLLNGLSKSEQDAYRVVLDRFFKDVGVGHWEGVEVAAHRLAVKQALAAKAAAE